LQERFFYAILLYGEPPFDKPRATHRITFMKIMLSLLASGLLLAGCNLSSLRNSFDKDEGKEVLSKAKFDRILIDSTGEIQVYASMNRATSLSPGAALQFSDPFKELYLIVIKESKASFEEALRDYRDQYVPYVKDSSSLISIYGDFTSTRTAKNMDGGKDSLISVKNLNGMEYRSYAITGSYQKIPLFYFKGIYKSGGYLYQVVTWTLADRRNLYEGVMQKMVESLTETPASQ